MNYVKCAHHSWGCITCSVYVASREKCVCMYLSDKHFKAVTELFLTSICQQSWKLSTLNTDGATLA